MTDLVAVFDDPDAADRALRALEAERVPDVRVASPAPYPAVHRTGKPGPWRLMGVIALCGGVAGLLGAAALQAVTSQRLGLVVGGKPILAWVAFGVVMFELTMLAAGVTNFVALVVLGAWARRRVPREVLAHVDSERIVVVVPVEDDRRAAIRAILVAAAGEVL
jgi:hypothetical protein